MPPTHLATRYVVPLREGGSLPAVVDTDGAGLFVVKFRGAGQGARALVAEILVAELALALDLPVPELALIHLESSFGRSERDPEIQDVLRMSQGLNVGLRYLEGAFNFDPLADDVDAELAAGIVWLDALTCHLDRTARNPNMLWWQDHLWLIDHGAALYFHHAWSNVDAERARDPFPAVKDHVLLAAAGDLEAVDRRCAALLTPEVLASAVGAVPDDLLMDATRPPPFASAEENRRAYRRYFERRMAEPSTFVAEALRARRELLDRPPARQGYRR